MRTTIALTAALLAVAPTVQAADLEIGYGMSRFSKQDNGIWWQAPFANEFDLKSQAYSIGARGTVGGVRVRAGYMDLGGVRSAALATASDADYATQACGGPCWPMSHWYGRSRVAGLYATVDPEIKVRGVGLFAELGAYYYRTRFDMVIPDWRACQTCVPERLKVSGDGGAHLTLLAGAGVRYARAELAVQYLRLHGGSVYPPNFEARTWDATIRLAF